MRISRKEMEEILDRNEGVIIDDKVITSKADLPTEAELAKGDKQAEAAARVSLEAQMDAIKQQMAMLNEDSKESKEATKSAAKEAKEAEETREAAEDFGKAATREAEARAEAEKEAAEVAVKNEETRKAEETKKAEVAKKEADRK